MPLPLVDRLRVFAQQKASAMVADILREAADEIERLRAENDRLRPRAQAYDRRMRKFA